MKYLSRIVLAIAVLNMASFSMDLQQTRAEVTINGNVFGGGKMADVTSTSGTTATIDIYAATITGDVYGGNDITGNVTQGTGNTAASAKITVHDKCSTATTVNEVYGGGNGYYKYKIGDTVIEPGGFTDANRSTAIAAGTTISVYAATADPSTATALISYTTTEATTYGAIQPEVTNTTVIVGETSSPEQKVKLTSVYGGAKNADVKGTAALTINSGTVTYAYAGNNVGGTANATSLTITGTKTDAALTAANSDWSKAGTDWGILEAYGGGNKVPVGDATITMTGGQVYMLFGGGNAATADSSVTLTFNCPAGSDGGIYNAKMIFGGNNQADMYVVPDLYVKRGKAWSIYGGGNAGDMKGVDAGTINSSKFIDNRSLPDNIYNTILPFFAGTDVMLDSDDGTSGLWVNNVYGGCRAANVDNSTYIRVTNVLHVDNVFGGCDIAGSVGMSPGKTTVPTTFTTYKDGDPHAHVMTPVSKTNATESSTVYSLPAGDMVYASTYVIVTGGTISGNVYGSGNGSYKYEASGDSTTVTDTKSGTNTVLAKYKTSSVNRPFVTSARVSLEGGTIQGNVYGGGYNAEVGKKITAQDITNADSDHKSNSKFKYYGKEYAEGDTLSRTSYLYLGHTDRAKTDSIKVNGDIFGGGCMADVYGTMDIIVRSETNLNTLYAGNDAAGHVIGKDRGQIQATASGNHFYGTMLYDLNDEPWNSFNGTALTEQNAGTYVRIQKQATIKTLFGGGNGDYTYTYNDLSNLVTITDKSNNTIGYLTPKSGSTAAEKIASVKPRMASSWLDIKGDITTVYGSGNAADNDITNVYITDDAHINTAYAGGNAATVTSKANIWADCNAANTDGTGDYNIKTLFGGNNTADMYIVPLMYLQRGKIGTIYGGGNAGSMKGVDAGTADMSKYLAQSHLPANIYTQYTPLWTGTDLMVDSDYGKDSLGIVTGLSGLRIDNIYGGCRAANVDNSTYIRITNADYVGNVFGGCDIAGSVGMSPGKLTAPQTFTTYEKGQGNFVPVKDPNDASQVYKYGSAGDDMLYSSTYIFVTGGTISGNVYGSGNGSYSYTTANGTTSVYDLKSGSPTQVATFDSTKFSQPFAASATIQIEGGTIDGNVYGGGYNAELGHIITQLDIDNADADHKYSTDSLIHYGKHYGVGDTLSRTCYIYVGHTDRAMSSTINLKGNVFGGGCLANVYGVMDILVKKDANINTLYAGNDASGYVYGKGRGSVQQLKSGNSDFVGTMLIDVDSKEYNSTTGIYNTNEYDSYSGIELNESNAGTYIRVEEGANITYLYGGGNGDYYYEKQSGNSVKITQKNNHDKIIGIVAASSADAAKPLQDVSFIDVAGTVTNLYGGGNAANVNTTNVWIVRDARVVTAFGGGNAATVTEKSNIWVDCNPGSEDASIPNNVTTLYGGNNTADMDILPSIYLWCGKIGTVYGGCNEGDMHGHDAFALDFSKYVSDYWMKQQTWILGYEDDGTRNKWTTPLTSKQYPLFSATELLIDSPYKIVGTTKGSNKVRLSGNETSEDLKAYSSGLYIGTAYGGCRAANVDNSTYTRITRVDHLDRVFGGNDIAGTVGENPGTLTADVELVAYKVIANEADSTRASTGVVFRQGQSMINPGSYVCITGGDIKGYVFGGGNGEKYEEFKAANGSSLDAPWCASTYVSIEGGTLEGSIYGGGNMAGIGTGSVSDTINSRFKVHYNPRDTLYGASNVFIGKTDRAKMDLDLNPQGENAYIYGGSRMADIYGSIDVLVNRGTNIQNLYLGNDISGKVVGNPDGKGRGTLYGSAYGSAALNYTILADAGRQDTAQWANWSYNIPGKAIRAFNGDTLDSKNAAAYLRVQDGATITNLYGGGNGDYTYTVDGNKINIKSKLTSTQIVSLAFPDSLSAASEADKIKSVKPQISASWIDMKGDATTMFGGGNAADSRRAMTYIADSAAVVTAYAGGNSATVTDTAIIVVCDSAAAVRNASALNNTYTVQTLYGGNNVDTMRIVPTIKLESGNIETVYAGGNKGQMHAANRTLASIDTLGTYIKIDVPAGHQTDLVIGSLFGGGNQAGVTKSTYIEISGGTITDAVYGGCNTSGEVLQNSRIYVHRADIGTEVSGADSTHNVLFGGGFGAATNVRENVYVTIDSVNAKIYGNVYGGGRQGPVNTDCDNETCTNISAGTIYGDVYGGAFQANIKGQIKMDISGTAKILPSGNDLGEGGSIYAANNQGGAPECDINVNYCADGDCQTALYGGGNLANYSGNSEIVFSGGKIGYIFGGANKANVVANGTGTGNSTVYLLGGEVCHDVYGGGRGELEYDQSQGKDVVVGGDVAGNSTVWVLDDRLDADGKYVIARTADGSGNTTATTTAKSGKILPDANGMPFKPYNWQESYRSQIKVGGNIYGGGKNGTVAGNSSVKIGEQ